MTNQSLRERFQPSEVKSAIVSQIIAATEEARLIKAEKKAGGSRKFARYISRLGLSLFKPDAP